MFAAVFPQRGQQNPGRVHDPALKRGSIFPPGKENDNGQTGHVLSP
jgi:hypothetical protein